MREGEREMILNILLTGGRAGGGVCIVFVCVSSVLSQPKLGKKRKKRREKKKRLNGGGFFFFGEMIEKEEGMSKRVFVFDLN